MPRSAEQRLRRAVPAVVVALGLVLSGCSGSGSGGASGSGGGSSRGAPATPTPVPTPTHIDLSQWDPEQGNGVTLLGGQGARAVIIAAMRSARTVTMTGTFTNTAGRTIRIDAQGAGSDSVARFTVDGGTTEVVLRGGAAYVLPSPALAAAEDLAPDAYACVALDDPLVTRWSPLAQPRRAVAELISDAVSLGEPADGVVELILGAEGTLGTMLIDAEGTPLPQSLTRADPAGRVQLEFTGWGEEVALPDEAELAAGC